MLLAEKAIYNTLTSEAPNHMEESEDLHRHQHCLYAITMNDPLPQLFMLGKMGNFKKYQLKNMRKRKVTQAPLSA